MKTSSLVSQTELTSQCAGGFYVEVVDYVAPRSDTMVQVRRRDAGSTRPPRNTRAPRLRASARARLRRRPKLRLTPLPRTHTKNTGS